MGLSRQTTGTAVFSEPRQEKPRKGRVIALAGNPNVGKSTVFNALTGLNQHTGNWPGKTVVNAEGYYRYGEKDFTIVDLPGTYSLLANSVEEEVARDFICFGGADATVIVADATALERNLNLVLQILEVEPHAVLCVNLLDEAEKKKIRIDLPQLAACLGVPVVGTSARAKKGLGALLAAIDAASAGGKGERFHIDYSPAVEAALSPFATVLQEQALRGLCPRWLALKLLDADPSLHAAIDAYLGYTITALPTVAQALAQAQDALLLAAIDPQTLRDMTVAAIVAQAEEIYQSCVHVENEMYNRFDRKLDKILTSRATGIPLMLLLLGLVFWLTISGANYPSQALSNLFSWLEGVLSRFFIDIGAAPWLRGVLIEGMFRTLGWVVSVMLPPMAIFFPLFTLLEDSGYLPRIAFNMDKFFKKACAHGKQSLTMCMGFGCNACGVVGCRIIDSPRERMIAMLTNNFVPCNGRFPSLIAIIAMFFAGSHSGGILAALVLLLLIVLGVALTLLVSKLLSKTLLKGLPSSFALELPPYRRPQIGQVVVRSSFDRTLFVLGRAVSVAAPAGILIWLLANIQVGDSSILLHLTGFLDPFARFIGMDGVILLAFFLAFPANEILIPLILMGYLATGSMAEMESLSALRNILVDNGWTWVTALCTMLFVLIHFPCATTCLTIQKESGSFKWTALAFLLPTLTGFLVCGLVANVARLFL